MSTESQPTTTAVKLLTELVDRARLETERLGGSTTIGDVLRHWLRLGMKADPKPKALLP